MAAKRLPYRHDTKNAPRFDDPEFLEEFFDDYEAMADEAGLDDKARIKEVTKYVDGDSKKSWKALPEATASPAVWEKFKDAVTKLYRAEDAVRYSKPRFEQMVSQYREGRDGRTVRTVEGFMEFHRKAIPYFTTLKAGGLVSANEVNMIYQSVFPEGDFKDMLLRRLEMKDQSVVPGQAHTIEQVREMALVLLRGQIMADGPSSSKSNGGSPGLGVPSAPSVKTESAGMAEALQKLANALIVQTQQNQQQQATLNQLLAAVTSGPQSGTYNANQGPQRGYASGGPGMGGGFGMRCIYCGMTDHRKMNCIALKADVEKGLCSIDQFHPYKIRLPDGREAPMNSPMGTMKDQVHAIHKSVNAGTGGAATSSLLFEGFELQPAHGQGRTESFALITEPDAGDDENAAKGGIAQLQNEIADLRERLRKTELMAFEATEGVKGKEGRGRVRFDGVEVPRMGKGVGSERERGKGKGEPAKGARAEEKGGKGTVPPARAVPSTDRPGHSTTQRKFISDFEKDDPGAADRLLEAVLWTEVTVKLQDLMAMAPDLRKAFKERSTSRKVVEEVVLELGGVEDGSLQAALVASGESFHQCHHHDTEPMYGTDEEGNVTAQNTLPLRYIPVMLNHKLTCKAVLDTGSTFVAMSRGVYKALKDTVRYNSFLGLTSANGSQSWTQGLLHNCVVSIGDMNIKLHIHVVDNAPFDLLLGQPFFALTRCAIEHTLDGDAELVMMDPNTKVVYRAPTFERTNGGPEVGIAYSGF